VAEEFRSHFPNETREDFERRLYGRELSVAEVEQSLIDYRLGLQGQRVIPSDIEVIQNGYQLLRYKRTQEAIAMLGIARRF
jgi:hypothetical protein